MLMRALRSALNSHGAGGIAKLAWRRILRSRARCYPVIQQLVSDKTGLEVGGPSPIFSRRGLLPLYPVAKRVDNCNFSSSTIWEGTLREGRTFRFDQRREPGSQFFLEATNLAPIAAETYDFVLASHVLEHSANPLRALSEFNRVLKRDGVLVIVVPHKEATFDHRRPVSTMAHLMDDYRLAAGEDDMTHLTEILELHDVTRDSGIDDDGAFRSRCRENMRNRCLHHHVFDTSLAVEMMNWLGHQVMFAEPALPHHIVLAGRKVSEPPQNALFLGENASFRTSSPFALDLRPPRPSPRGTFWRTRRHREAHTSK